VRHVWTEGGLGVLFSKGLYLFLGQWPRLPLTLVAGEDLHALSGYFEGSVKGLGNTAGGADMSS
jgi:hypothetical protein